MKTEQKAVTGEVHDLYIEKINKLIEDGRESMISDLVAEYHELGRTPSTAVIEAA